MSTTKKRSANQFIDFTAPEYSNMENTNEMTSTEKSTNFLPVIHNEYLHDYKFYYQYYGKIPNIYELTRINIEKAIEFFNKEYKSKILNTFFKRNFSYKKKKYFYEEFFFLLQNDIMISFNEGHTARILHWGKDEVNTFEPLAAEIKKFKLKEDNSRREISLITSGEYGLDLTALEIKKTNLNISLNYNDDFQPISELIFARLSKRNDKGVILLYGYPGTGKTTYLRYLVAKLNKKVLFIPPDIAANIANPDFVNILINNPNSVLIIEDAENIIIDRKQSERSVVSVLLNLSDGLLSDCLNVQIICTFNTELSSVDTALLRKGRLIAKYEFKKLVQPKAQALSNHLGFKTIINEEMALSDIYNQDELTFSTTENKTPIGF
jgi:hypothetical protein